MDADAASRYEKDCGQPLAMDELPVALSLEAHETVPAEIILDVDSTDDPLHVYEEGRFLHGY